MVLSESSLGTREQFPQVPRAMVCIPTANVSSSWLFVRAPEEACQGIHCWPCKLSSCICLQWHELALLSPPQMGFQNLKPCTLNPRMHLLWNFWSACSGASLSLYASWVWLSLFLLCSGQTLDTQPCYSVPTNSSFFALAPPAWLAFVVHFLWL